MNQQMPAIFSLLSEKLLHHIQVALYDYVYSFNGINEQDLSLICDFIKSYEQYKIAHPDETN